RVRTEVQTTDGAHGLRSGDRDRLAFGDWGTHPPRAPKRVQDERDADLEDRLEDAIGDEIEEGRAAGARLVRIEEGHRRSGSRNEEARCENTVVRVVQGFVGEDAGVGDGHDPTVAVRGTG